MRDTGELYYRHNQLHNRLTYMNTSTGIAVAAAVAVALIFLFFGSSLFSLFSPNTTVLMPEQQAPQNPGTLQMTDTVVGTGAEAQVGSTVTVNYVGMFQDGTVFDASANHGQPYTFVLGQGAVIAGWDQGLIGMKAGGKRLLSIPPELGYGPNDYGPIPGNSTLIFEVEMVQVQN